MRFEQIGRYQIKQELGKGAMGEVFLAYDPDLDREVAVKTIYYDPGIPSDELKETKLRFMREARISAKLSHPNIIIIHDVGEHESVPFIAMEYICGETLDPYVKSVSLLPLKRVVEIVGQAADALNYAHRSGLVHRDIKPSNIMLTPDGGVKVMDFGLAKKPSANLTQAGMLLGTPSYMSPEQIKGGALDGRSDLFSLGIVLYQLLTGEKPFKGETISTIMYKIMNEEPPEPTILNKKLPKQFDGIVRKALAKNAAARFQSGKDFRAALEDYLNFTSRMTRVKPTAPLLAEGTQEETAALARSSLPVAMAPKPSFSLKPFLKAAAGAALLAGALFLGYQPAKGWAKEKSMEPEFPLPTFLITWANDGENPRLLNKHIYVEVERGAALTLDGWALERPVLKFPVTDQGEHELVATLGCRRAERRFRVQDVDEALSLTLEPALIKVQLTTIPEGAMLHYGEDFSQTTATPAILTLDACLQHDIKLTLDGYHERKEFIAVALDRENRFDPYVLEPLPKSGRVRFAKGAYPYEVRHKGKILARGGREVELLPGTYAAQIVNDDYFLEMDYEFQVDSEKLRKYTPRFPALGKLSVMCYTSGAVFINDKPAGDAPFREKKIAAGRYKVKCVMYEEGRSRPETVQVEVQPRRATEIRFAKDKPRWNILQ
jgi:serine/threonine-protein kinase